MSLFCHLCGACCEYVIHTLRYCHQAKRIWTTLGFVQNTNFNIYHHCDRFKCLATTNQGQLFLITCWFIWRALNEGDFSDIQWSDWEILSKINSLLVVVLKAFGNAFNKKQSQLASSHVPFENSVKLNVDGSSFGNLGRSGFGGSSVMIKVNGWSIFLVFETSQLI